MLNSILQWDLIGFRYRYEKLMLTHLEFKLSLPTSYSFLTRFLKAGKSSLIEKHLANFYLQRSLQEFKLIQYLPSLLAASCLYYARCTTFEKDSKQHWVNIYIFL